MVFELQGSENRGLPLTWLITLTAVHHYRADFDVTFYSTVVVVFISLARRDGALTC